MKIKNFLKVLAFVGVCLAAGLSLVIAVYLITMAVFALLCSSWLELFVYAALGVGASYGMLKLFDVCFCLFNKFWRSSK